MKQKTKELIFEITMLVVSLLFIFVIIPMQTTPLKDMTTLQPGTFPTIAMWITALASVISLIETLMKGDKEEVKNNSELPEEQEDEMYGTARHLLVFAVILLYVLCVKYIGFYVTTFIAMTLAFKKFYKFKGYKFAIGIVIFLVVIYVLFDIALHIPMPTGLLI